MKQILEKVTNGNQTFYLLNFDYLNLFKEPMRLLKCSKNLVYRA